MFGNLREIVENRQGLIEDCADYQRMLDGKCRKAARILVGLCLRTVRNYGSSGGSVRGYRQIEGHAVTWSFA
jgi:hypothetical protein